MSIGGRGNYFDEVTTDIRPSVAVLSKSGVWISVDSPHLIKMVACVELFTRCDGSFALSSAIVVVIDIVLIVATDQDDAQCTMHNTHCTVYNA